MFGVIVSVEELSEADKKKIGMQANLMHVLATDYMLEVCDVDAEGIKRRLSERLEFAKTGEVEVVDKGDYYHVIFKGWLIEVANGLFDITYVLGVFKEALEGCAEWKRRRS